MKPGDFLSTSIKVCQYALSNCNPRPYIDDVRKVIIKKGRLMFQDSSEVGNDEEIQELLFVFQKGTTNRH